MIKAKRVCRTWGSSLGRIYKVPGKFEVLGTTQVGFHFLNDVYIPPKGRISTELETANVSSPHIHQILDVSARKKKIPQAIKSITLKFFILSCLHPGDLIL